MTADRRRRMFRLLAVLLPFAIMAVSTLGLQRPEAVTGKALAFDRRLRHSEPEVLVLGSSLARTNVRQDVLSEVLGVDQARIEILTLPNATAPHWLAILENRIYAEGYNPKLVLVVGALTTIVTPEILMDSSVERLMNQLGPDEPVIASKVLHTDSVVFLKLLFMRERAGAVRDALLNRYRNVVLSVLFDPPGNADASRLAERTNEVVFADDRMDYDLHQASATGTAVRYVEQLDLTGVDPARDSLIPDLSDLVGKHGGRMVFVRTPFPPSNHDNDFVPPSIEAASAKVIADHGATWLDLRALHMGESLFQDMRHMNQEGAEVFTRALGQGILAEGLLRSDGSTLPTATAVDVEWTFHANDNAANDAIHRATPVGPCRWEIAAPWSAMVRPEAPPWEVAGPDGPIPWTATPAECSASISANAGAITLTLPQGTTPNMLSTRWRPPTTGSQGIWLPAGAILRARMAQGWGGDSASFRVLARATSHLGTSGVVVRLGSDETRLTPTATGGWIAWSPQAPEEAWMLEIANPAVGQPVLLENLALGRPPSTTHLIGVPETLVGWSIRLVGGRVQDTGLTPVFADPPPAVDGQPRRGPSGLGVFLLEDLAAISDAADTTVSHPHQCSPVLVLEDGVALAQPHAMCVDAMQLGGGRTCHVGNTLYFASTDGSSPLGNGRAYSVALDPSRLCDRRNQKDTTPLRGSLWMYPEDRVSIGMPTDERAGHLYDLLEVDADAIKVTDGGRLLARVVADGVTVGEGPVLVGGEGMAKARISLSRSVTPADGHVHVEIVNGAADWWLLRSVTLGDASGRALTDAVRSASDVGNSVPTSAGVAGALTLRAAERIGSPPATPDMRDPTLQAGVWEAKAFALWPVSNSVLERDGWGAWSPLRAADASGPLALWKDKRAFRQGCIGCYLHFGPTVYVRPRGRDLSDITWSIDMAAPMMADKTEVWWVFDGGGLRWTIAEPIPGHVEVMASVAVRDPHGASAAPVLRVAGQSVDLGGDGANRSGSIGVDDLPANWQLEILAPKGGPWLLVTDLSAAADDGIRDLIRLTHEKRRE